MSRRPRRTSRGRRLWPSDGAAQAQATAAHALWLDAQMLGAISSGSYPDVLRAQAAFLAGPFSRGLVPVVLGILGRFCLGLVAGRRGLFHAPGAHRRLFRGLLWGGLAVGGLASVVHLLLQWLALRRGLDATALAWRPYALAALRQASEVGIAAFYVAGFTLLFQREAWRRVLDLFAPVGRMALTNYLTQTVVHMAVFYGFGLGLVRRGVGPAGALAVALCTFAAQAVASRLWLARFQFGPLEYVWRTLTYGRAPALRRTASA